MVEGFGDFGDMGGLGDFGDFGLFKDFCTDSLVSLLSTDAFLSGVLIVNGFLSGEGFLLGDAFLTVTGVAGRLHELMEPSSSEPAEIEPRCEKTGLRGFRPGPTQTGLYSQRRWLEA